jgi:hypothetical protein
MIEPAADIMEQIRNCEEISELLKVASKWRKARYSYSLFDLHLFNAATDFNVRYLAKRDSKECKDVLKQFGIFR